MRSLLFQTTILLVVAVIVSGCGDKSANCAPPCFRGVDVHNGTTGAVYFVLRDEPRETTRVEPNETAAISMIMPRYGDLATKEEVFRALDSEDRTVFCKRVTWSDLKKVNRVEIRAGEIDC